MSNDIEILETSFDLIAPRGDELMDEFYSRLFDAAPAVRPLFPADMRKQKAMLLSALVPTLHALGARHVGYGALPEHYPVVGSVLIESMAAIAGDAWTPEIEGAWSAAFNLIAGAMIEGAESAELAEAA